ncbi:Nucleotide-sugar transporter/UAA transporter family, putative [Angomonas deanei]|uniref:Nucleotide-sugar transporter/UAA transporter family, putative n=1 Tax=Angomonas deanei TaxID=59799 RepID=A0A7G2CG98_9TRYP|nr:Nucleotide-sugar transporter/UAA transporter family, putative [Angomonas deanei]
MSALQSICLVLLVAQNAASVVLSRYSRHSVPKEEQFYSLSTVVSQEVVKYAVFFSLFVHHLLGDNNNNNNNERRESNAVVNEKNDAVVVIEEENAMFLHNNNNNYKTYRKLSYRCLRQNVTLILRQYRNVIFKKETLLMGVPAALYTFQGFIFFFSMSRIDPLTFQILAQSRVFFTAVLSVIFLNRKISRAQSLCLLFLVLGSILTQVPDSVWQASKKTETETSNKKSRADALWGSLACLTQSLSSSFAGVYMEKLMKGSKVTLAEKSLQLGLFALPFAFLTMLVVQVWPNWQQQRQHNAQHDVHYNIFSRPHQTYAVRPFYYFEGYHHIVTLLVIACQAGGGIIITLIMRYSSNIAKVFATSISVLVCGVLSWMIWGLTPGLLFTVGAVIVIASTVRYSLVS